MEEKLLEGKWEWNKSENKNISIFSTCIIA